jgi:hypothetical protein
MFPYVIVRKTCGAASAPATDAPTPPITKTVLATSVPTRVLRIIDLPPRAVPGKRVLANLSVEDTSRDEVFQLAGTGRAGETGP